ncbi:MAG: CHASE2 domain-containing protein, partial [Gammaproteobacteria bacterium]|nr:CHASE2 domain-containing protein [Gammaproteobacteria bacterium]
ADGVIRRAPLFIRYGETLFPSLALAAVMQSRQESSVILESGPEGMISIAIGDTRIPVDRQGNLAVRFRGPSGTYRSVSAADILDGEISAETFQGKIVFVGSSAEGLKDTHPTPFERRFAGVEVHASIAGAILDEEFIAVPAWATGAQGASAFLVVVLALTVVLRFPTWAAGGMLFGLLFLFP